jgi:hypothetical protein
MYPRGLVKGRVLWLLALSWLVLADTALAQVSTATVQGVVREENGVLPGANVTARHVESGFSTETVTAEDGSYTLGGLRPGAYEITVSFAQFKPQAKKVEVLVGQTATLDFRISSDIVLTENVTVVGETRIVETRTSQVTTNVTPEQVRFLPQNTRNFLNFAALAPGIRVADSPRGRCRRSRPTSSSTGSATRTT